MSATGTLGVTTQELTEVGNQMKNISGDVNTIFTKVKNIVGQVTSNDSWKSEASETFAEKFEVIKASIEEDLANLEALGPTLTGAANEYEQAEETNTSQINDLTDYN
jgi:WXG100 family type VII secretion target